MKTSALLPRVLGIFLCLFTLAEVNYPRLSPQSQLAILAAGGMALAFLMRPLEIRRVPAPLRRGVDWLLVAGAVLCGGYVVVQTEPLFRGVWSGGSSLGDRAGLETGLDIAVGVVGLILVLEATRRSVGWALPILAGLFLAYAHWGPALPSWLLPHRGYGAERIVSQTFLHSQGVFGVALNVMFTYVVLFVVFGALLEATGATGFILNLARRLFRKSPGGAAKVAVVSSGLMGSLSGSAVANTATTGTFTIPMMRSAGFKRHVAGGVEAAASSGGALVPPVMGAGAYMMLEIIQPPVSYLEIVRAALLPALLYYASLFLVVHFFARRDGAEGATGDLDLPPAPRFGGVVFGVSFFTLIGFLLVGFTVFRSVTLALASILVVSSFHPSTRMGFKALVESLAKAGRDMVPLINAAACVGVILGVVTLTGIGSRLPALLLPLAQESLLLALGALMVSSIVLGMGLPSAVCYLLLATLVGPVLGDLGVVPLAAHLFIFYFGMMSMVTPPVALAAYTAASISGSGILRTSFAAFRFALVGFTLPFLFVLRPQLLMLAPGGGTAPWLEIVGATLVAAAGLLPFAAGIAGYLFSPLGPVARAALFLSSLLLLLPWDRGGIISWDAALGLTLLAGVTVWSWRRSRLPA